MTDPKQRLMPLLEQLCTLVLDSSKRVQQAAISALAELMDKAQGALIPFIPTIIPKLQECLRKYQRKNLPFLFDCLLQLITTYRDHIFQNEAVFTSKFTPLVDDCVRRMLCSEDHEPALYSMTEFLATVADFSGEKFC